MLSTIEKIVASFFFVFFIFSLLFLIGFAIKVGKEEKAEALIDYQYCKEQNVDIEWCFKVFEPEFNNNIEK